MLFFSSSLGRYISITLYALGCLGLVSAFINMGLTLYLQDEARMGKTILGWTEVANKK